MPGFEPGKLGSNLKTFLCVLTTRTGTRWSRKTSRRLDEGEKKIWLEKINLVESSGLVTDIIQVRVLATITVIRPENKRTRITTTTITTAATTTTTASSSSSSLASSESRVLLSCQGTASHKSSLVGLRTRLKNWPNSLFVVLRGGRICRQKTVRRTTVGQSSSNWSNEITANEL